jgi:hypothetical protein
MNSGTGCVTSFIASHHAQPAIDGYVSVMRVITPSSPVKLVRPPSVVKPSDYDARLREVARSYSEQSRMPVPAAGSATVRRRTGGYPALKSVSKLYRTIYSFVHFLEYHFA